MSQLDTLTRRDDHQTSIDAAARQLPKMSELQGKVFAALQRAGINGMTDGELEKFADEWGCSKNTVRCRRKDLFKMKRPLVIKVIDPETRKQRRRENMGVWRALTNEELHRRDQGELFYQED